MSWETPSLSDVRQQNADYIVGKLGTNVLPNGETRVLADANAGNAHLNLQYLDWLATQLLPDTAEDQFLDKWGNIFLVNADGSRGRKVGTYAIGVNGTIFPAGSLLIYGTVAYETTAQVVLGSGPTTIAIRALDVGAVGNLAAGTTLAIQVAIAGVSGTAGATVVSLTGGSDQETNDELRARVLQRIRQPPMGGDADDYVQWALQVAGVTRAWCSPLEMGMGTVTLRFMCDDLRAPAGGLPNASDIAAVQSYLDTVRPVAVKDFFVVAPILQPVSFGLSNFDIEPDRGTISAAVITMLKRKASPAYSLNGVPQPPVDIPAAWVSQAVYGAIGGGAFDLTMADAIMASKGCMAVLGSINYG